MNPLRKALSSSVGKKYLMAITGLALVGFVITHLLGNLTLYAPSGSVFNAYAAKLESLEGLIVVAEAGLIAFFLIHIFNGICVTRTNKKARPVSYQNLRSKGGESKSSVASRNMIISGLLILGFVIVHVVQFKFGPSEAQGYVTELHGEKVRDLHRLVVETFKNPLYVVFYVVMIGFLGLHLRHGFWSAFQSIGVMNRRLTAIMYGLSALLALALAIGFLFIPIWIYFDIGGMLYK